MDLMKILQSQLTDGIMDQLANQVGGNRQQTTNATTGILNTLVGALTKNATNEKGAASLFNALEKDHDGSLLDNLTDFINPSAPNPVNDRTANGLGILQHLFGDKKDNIAQNIGQQSGLNQQNTLGLMSKLAPIVMAALGKQKQQKGFNITDMMGFLNNERQSMSQQKSSRGFLKMLDFDGDGSGLNDALGILGRLFKRRK